MFNLGKVDEGTIEANSKVFNVTTEMRVSHTGTAVRASATTKTGQGYYHDGEDDNAALKVLIIAFGGVLVGGGLLLSGVLA